MAPTGVAPEPVAPTALGEAERRAPAVLTVEAYGIAFLPGDDDVERLLTELRRRGKWAQSLRGQEVSSASAPAVLLVGDVSCGQRRLTRMIARTLAEAGQTSGEVRTRRSRRPRLDSTRASCAKGSTSTAGTRC